MRKINYFLILILLISFIVSGCKKNDQNSGISPNTEYSGEPVPQNSDLGKNIADEGDTPYSDNDNSLTDEELQKIGKKIVKTANVSISVKNYDKKILDIKNTLKKFDCYISSEKEENYNNKTNNTLIIRVKSGQFDSLLNMLLAGEGKILSKEISVKDITEDYIDIYQRLKNKELTEQQYQEILKKAYTVNDILTVNEYLRKIQEEIESAKGKLKYMDKQASYSTIILNISENTQEINKNNFWRQIIKGLGFGWQLVIYVFLAIFYIWPVWILLVIIIFVVRRQKNKKPKTPKND